MKVPRQWSLAKLESLLPREPPRCLESHASGVHVHVIADGKKGDAEIHARAGGHRRSPHRDLDQFLLPHLQGILRKSGWILESPRIHKRNPSRRSDCDPVYTCKCATCSSHRDPTRNRYSTIDRAMMMVGEVMNLCLLADFLDRSLAITAGVQFENLK